MKQRDQHIQHNFNRASEQYLRIAHIQNHAAHKLLHAAKPYINSSSQIILDLGCGPGTFNHLANRPKNWILGLDLSHTMLHKNLVPSPINAHAESLPLASNSIDIIISNLMLQWPENKRQALAETHRVLKPGGKLIFTTLIQPSLHELITSWAQIDEAKHTLSFLMPEDYLSLCHQARLGILAQSLWHETLFFSNFIELCRHFKDSGTSLPYAKRRGLGGKDALRRIEQLYPHRARGLPLSYHYLMLVLHKEA